MQDNCSVDTRQLRVEILFPIRLNDRRKVRSSSLFRRGKILLAVLQNFI